MDSLCLRGFLCFHLFLTFSFVLSDPEFCTRGFKMASRFYNCWEQATFRNKYLPLYQPHQFLDGPFVEAYASHMCSVVKPDALQCLRDKIQECSNIHKLMEMADKSGGACQGNEVNPFFKTHVIDKLQTVKSDSPCFDIADNTYQCYNEAGQRIMQAGGSSDNIVTFHRVADKFFNAYWECVVEIFQSNLKICPHWQIPMLLTLQKTAMPSLFGLKLRPEQIYSLGLGQGEAINPGPSKLYLLLQLHKTWPQVNDEESVVLELDDLNHDPHLELDRHNHGGTPQQQTFNPESFTLKELKNMLGEQRRRNTELKEFIKQAKEGLDKTEGGKKKNTEGSEKKSGISKKVGEKDIRDVMI